MNAIRVIFVDDEPRVLEGLKRMLRPKRNEWDMTFVGSAQAALDALKVQPREVVVTDMRMPGMNGAELLEVVQREYPDTIRLILSGQAETESVMKALGVSHQFLSKPCDAEILQGTISRAFALRDLAGSEAVKGLVARINKLPTLPATYQKLVETLKQPNSSIEDVSAVIATDPAMTARLLKLVNSAYFGLQKPVADVTRAGALLGLDRIMALVLGQGIFSDCDPPKVEGFSMDALWHHSVTTAAAAHRIAIAEQMDREHVAAAFLAGMLHDIGKLVLAMGLPEQYARVLKLAGDRPGELQLILPVAAAFQINPLHLGAVFLLNLELGYLTPPVGMNLFLSSYRFNRPMHRITRAVLPFMLVQLTAVLLVTYIPWLSEGFAGWWAR